jgi:hypothetical protein
MSGLSILSAPQNPPPPNAVHGQAAQAPSSPNLHAALVHGRQQHLAVVVGARKHAHRRAPRHLRRRRAQHLDGDLAPRASGPPLPPRLRPLRPLRLRLPVMRRRLGAGRAGAAGGGGGGGVLLGVRVRRQAQQRADLRGQGQKGAGGVTMSGFAGC